ncbi:hypothetical protein OAS39_00200 [Pirellulales bacterium]|nr:hypothetical protein [Pirellulales bacterium]
MDDTQHDASRPRWLGMLLVFAVFLIQGFVPAPNVNETHYLAKAKHYWDASYCPGDFFLESSDAHLAFYWTVGWVTQVAPLPVAAWITRVAAWLWLAWGWQRLSAAVRIPPLASALAALLFMAGVTHANFAGEWVVGGVEAKCFAYGFVLLGMAAMAEGRWTAMGMHFGAASAMHILVGGWALAAGLFVWCGQTGSRRESLPRLAIGLAVGGVISLAGLLPALALTAQASPEVAADAAQVYVFDRLPHHLAPLALRPEELLVKLWRFGLLTGIMFVLWRLCATRLQDTEATERDPGLVALLRVMQFAGLAVIANGIGAMLQACLVEQPEMAARVLRYYWFRQADVAVPMAAALGAVKLAPRFPHGVGRALLTAAVLASIWHISTAPAFTRRPWIPPAAKRTSDFAAWRDACEWVRQNAPPDALFLVPWKGQSFKWYAHRADVVNRKDIPQDANGVIEWARRRDLAFPARMDGKLRMQLSFKKRSADALRQIARQVGATHVLSADTSLRLPIVYQNDHYAVYEIAPLAEPLRE